MPFSLRACLRNTDPLHACRIVIDVCAFVWFQVFLRHIGGARHGAAHAVHAYMLLFEAATPPTQLSCPLATPLSQLMPLHGYNGCVNVRNTLLICRRLVLPYISVSGCRCGLTISEFVPGSLKGGCSSEQSSNNNNQSAMLGRLCG